MKYIIGGLISIMLLLSSCAYQPMYGKTHDQNMRAGSKGLSEVEVANIPNRAGQILRNDLIDRINYAGYSDKTNYILTAGLMESRTSLANRRCHLLS